jgi:hypothetical protein
MGNKHIDALIRTARGEVGYLEKASDAQLEDKTANAGKANRTKYGAWLRHERSALVRDFRFLVRGEGGYPGRRHPEIPLLRRRRRLV